MPTNASTPYKRNHKAPPPRRIVFDPWNSASTGHQRAENRLASSSSWRDSRTFKINAQFGSGIEEGGGQRLSDLVGAGNENYGSDGRTDTGWEDSVQGWRGRQGIAGQGWGEVGEMLNGQPAALLKQTRKRLDEEQYDNAALPPPSAQQPKLDDEDGTYLLDEPIPDMSATYRNSAGPAQDQSTRESPAEDATPNKVKCPQIFSSLTILINGSTYPTISDHKLKYLLTTHGARLSNHHARRQVTHVIIGRPNSKGTDDSRVTSIAAGGGLAGGKLEKEILKKSGGGGLSKGVRYVSVEWVTESIKAGIRLPESRFPGVNTAPKGVRSVKDLLKTG